MSAVRGPFDDAPERGLDRFLPAATVIAGSSLTLWPTIASIPLLPPLGLLMLLGWRLVRPERMRAWMPLPLGLYDDLLSGQPLGSAMLLWTLCFVMIDLIEQRILFRDFPQDWLIAAGALGFCLIVGRFVTTPLAAHVDPVLMLQLAVAILLYPLAARLCALLGGPEEDA